MFAEGTAKRSLMSSILPPKAPQSSGVFPAQGEDQAMSQDQAMSHGRQVSGSWGSVSTVEGKHSGVTRRVHGAGPVVGSHPALTLVLVGVRDSLHSEMGLRLSHPWGPFDVRAQLLHGSCDDSLQGHWANLKGPPLLLTTEETLSPYGARAGQSWGPISFSHLEMRAGIIG